MQTPTVALSKTVWRGGDGSLLAKHAEAEHLEAG